MPHSLILSDTVVATRSVLQLFLNQMLVYIPFSLEKLGSTFYLWITLQLYGCKSDSVCGIIYYAHLSSLIMIDFALKSEFRTSRLYTFSYNTICFFPFGFHSCEWLHM